MQRLFADRGLAHLKSVVSSWSYKFRKGLIWIETNKVLHVFLYGFAWLVGSCLPLLQAALLPLPLILICGLVCYSILRPISKHLSWSALLLSLALCHATNQFQSHQSLIIGPELEGLSVQVGGEVLGLPSIDQGRARFQFRVKQVRTANAQSLVGQKLQLSCYRCPLTIEPDSQWWLSVRLKRPRGYASWGAFDYEKYLFRQGVVATGYVRVKEPNSFIEFNPRSIHALRSDIKVALLDLKSLAVDSSGITANLQQGLAMMVALTVGDKSLMQVSQKQTFQLTGVSHLMVISGLHIGLVFIFVSRLCALLFWPIAKIYLWWPKQHWVLVPSLAAAFGYAALAGFGVSTQRAVITLSVFTLCKILGRDISLLRVVIVSACLIVGYDPASILDLGFWLSFAAVTIIAISQLKMANPSLVVLQIIIWLSMLPLTQFLFGHVSVISPLVNLIAVPLFCLVLIPIILLLTITFYLCLSMEVLIFQTPLLWLEHALGLLTFVLQWIYTQLNELSMLSWAAFYPASITASGLFALILLALCWLTPFSKRVRSFATICVIVVMLLGFNKPILGANEPSRYQLTLLDVDQGLAMVITVGDYVLVYDTGPAYPSGFNAADAVLVPYLRSRGIAEIDLLIISHADNDHIGGLPAVQAAMPVRKVLTSRVDKIPTATDCLAGQRWQVQEVQFRILGPTENTPKGSNNRSCVLRVDNGDVSVLITGDIERRVERFMLQQGVEVHSDVMLVPHQGSKTSSTPEWLDSVAPSMALIAAGYRNHYGHPHGDVVARYTARSIDLLSTVTSGSIILNIKKNKIEVSRYREAERRFWHD